MSDCRNEAGRLFQILGPATEKLLSPSRMFVLGTVRENVGMSGAKLGASGFRSQLAVVDQVRRSLTSQGIVSLDESGQLVVDPLLQRKPVQAIRRTGEMWSRRLAPVRKRAAAFWIDCRCLNRLSMMP